MNTGARVLLRIRVVKMQAPEHMGSQHVSILAGDRVVKLLNQKSEWAMFYLKSWEDTITFQVGGWNASCLCNEIDGTKRIDVSDRVRILVEGYAIHYRENRRDVTVEMAKTATITENCHLLYPTTNCDRRLGGYEVSEVTVPVTSVQEVPIPGPEIAKKTIVPGPVDIALGWMNLAFDSNTASTLSVSRRITYDAPFHVPDRSLWDLQMTTMSSKSSGDDISRLMRTIEFSENLTKAFIL